ncbi:MAG: hypothetical protein ACP5H2_11535 [Solirubrobacteraceae bacterium]
MEKQQPRWWDARRAQNLKPSTYRCPLCGELLPAMSDHMLLFPEGDHRRRRHAHTACVLRARAAGTLPTRDEWRRSSRQAGRARASERELEASEGPSSHATLGGRSGYMESGGSSDQLTAGGSVEQPTPDARSGQVTPAQDGADTTVRPWWPWRKRRHG